MGATKSVMFWPAGDMSLSGLGKLLLGAHAKGQAGELVLSLNYTWVLTANALLCLAGIEPHGNMVKQPAIFTVDTISAGQGDLMVFIEDPEGNREEVCPLNTLCGKVKLV